MQHHRPESKPHQKSVGIMLYTIGVCLSCLYLQTQYFQYILDDKKAFFMAYLTIFDVFMCIWSYIQTIIITNKPQKLAKLPFQSQTQQKFFDFEYSLQKQCEFCKYYKWPRVSHCSTCGTCIYKLDHHCVWTQTCIGFCNQKSFLLFCFYMTIGVFQFWYFTYRVLRQNNRPMFESIQPGICLLWMITGLSAGLVGLMIVILFISQTIMFLTNFRTLDSIKTRNMCPVPFFGRQMPFPNLYDRGELQNIKQLFFANGVWLWWVPLKRELKNEFFTESMSPHPDKAKLMKQTDLYQIQRLYLKNIDLLTGVNLRKLFIGKQIKVNNLVYRFLQQ